ncbi:L,D-transpeptidase [bacterium]|nr:L,D-transpeptidase [bacterium]
MRKILVALFIFLIVGHISNVYAAPKKYLKPIIMLDEDAAAKMKGTRGYWIEVQVPQRRLILAKGDHIIRIFPVAVGQPEYPSPQGWRSIDHVIWNPWWSPPPQSDWVEDATPIKPRSDDNPLGEIKMPLGNLYLIHGTKAVDSIGKWASHGCIRMLFEDIFSLVQLMMSENSKISAVDAMEKANADKSQQFSTPLTSDIPVLLTYNTVKVKGTNVTIYPDFYNREGNRVQTVASKLEPYLEDGQVVSLKRTGAILKNFKDQTINLPLKEFLGKQVEKKEEDENDDKKIEKKKTKKTKKEGDE